MKLMVACAILLLVGLLLGGVWSRLDFRSPDPPGSGEALTPTLVAARVAWFASLALTGGVVAGITVIGGGGRLAMRLLAVTAGDPAQGRTTEAGETVGEITVDGTVGFVLFNGIFGGVAAASLYLLVRRFLPRARFGGATFGVGLLILAGTTIDPLRADNPDFDIVGPGWLSLVVFGALAVAFGIVLAGVLARLSQWLPLLAVDRRVLLRYLAPALLAVLAFSITALVVVITVAAIVLTRWQPLVDAVRSRRWITAGRVVGIVAVLIALPSAVSTFIDIGSR
ncbi:hypothetical protein [Ilumatobacter sp.]|uniref:hypothetical protein n=1 Tax=Ilumatobacter sp. TaxID=1967498 RepID=UPI003C31AD71